MLDIVHKSEFAGGTSQTAQKGMAASYALAITPQNGFAGSVSFACTNLPQYASCSFNPASATVGAAPLGVTVTISTQQQQTADLHPGNFGSALIPGYLAFVLLLPLGIRRYRRVLRRHLLLSVLLIALVLLPLAGCGGGGGSSTIPPPTTLYTAAGTYTVTLTVISGGFSHSAPLTLIVTN